MLYDHDEIVGQVLSPVVIENVQPRHLPLVVVLLATSHGYFSDEFLVDSFWPRPPLRLDHVVVSL